MQWSGQAAYFTAPREIWMVNNNIAGYAKSAKTLTLVVVNNAGHMVGTYVDLAHVMKPCAYHI